MEVIGEKEGRGDAIYACSIYTPHIRAHTHIHTYITPMQDTDACAFIVAGSTNLEGEPPTENKVEKHTDAPHVYWPAVVPLPIQHLGSHIEGSPGKTLGVG